MSLANVFNNGSVGGGAGPTTSNWATVLSNGAASGANNPIISTTQKINYVDNITIDSQLATAPILIGNAAIANSADSVAIGNGASTASFTGSVAIGKNATAGGNNIIQLGTSTTPTIALGGLSISNSVPTNTTSQLLTLSKTAGVPTGVAEGALIYDSTNKLFMARDNVSWKPVQTAATATPAWSATLAVSNVSGANDVTISTTQKINYADTIKISSGTANSPIFIGASATTASINGIAIGSSANASATGACAIGANTTASNTNAYALGASATASGTDSLALGSSATTAGFASSVALGGGATCTAASQIMHGTSAFSNVFPGNISMSTGLATTNTTQLLTLPKIAGTPTGAASSGTIAYDSTNNILYARIGAAWNAVQTSAPATPTLAQVLVAGNSTSTTDIAVSSGQNITYATGIRIGSNATAPLAGVSTTGVTIGAGSGNASSLNVASTVCVGSTATCSGSNATAIGSGSSSAGSGVAVGVGAAAGNNSIAEGSNATNGGSSQAITIGAGGALGSTCTSSIAIGYATTSLNSITDSIVIGRATQIVSIDGIGIGRQTSSSGTRSVSIGAAVANHANNSDCVLLGANISNTTSGNTSITALGASITVTAGANSTDSVAIGKGATIPAGVTNQVYFTSGFAAATAAAGSAVSVDPGGRFHVNTSSIRYKQDVKPLRDPERILNLRAVDYAMKNSEEHGMSCGCPEYILDEEGNSVKNPCDGLKCGIRDVGMIAEELANNGCEDFVVFAPDPNDPNKRRCHSIKYDRLVGPIIEVLKKQKYRMEFLEDENLMLADKITTLQNSNDAMKVKLDWLESKIIQSA